jgi:uncharacterized membrane protein YeaQ/YmgE (transglycosylase-associated protein family)
MRGLLPVAVSPLEQSYKIALTEGKPPCICLLKVCLSYCSSAPARNMAGQIVQGTGFGLVGDIIIGIVGAFIASWLFPQLGIHLGAGIVAAIIAATIGAVLLLVIVRLVRRGGRW